MTDRSPSAALRQVKQELVDEWLSDLRNSAIEHGAEDHYLKNEIEYTMEMSAKADALIRKILAATDKDMRQQNG